jgi:hypothetical protein
VTQLAWLDGAATNGQVISYARLTDRLDGGTRFSVAQILLPNAASWLLMAASAVPLTWALRQRVCATGCVPCHARYPTANTPTATKVLPRACFRRIALKGSRATLTLPQASMEDMASP